MKEIKITTEENNYIEKLWYNYNSLLNLITYMTQNNVAADQQVYYKDSLQNAFAELEIGKRKIVAKYVDFPYTHYEFNFDNETLMVG